MIDRTLIKVRLADGWCLLAIARALGRSPGMVSDEVARHGGKACYAAQATQTQVASVRGRYGRKPRLGAEDALFAEVADLLRRGWSPEQIAGRRTYVEDGMEQQADLAISHEAIYALPRGELRHGRVPKGSERREKLCDVTPISERPAGTVLHRPEGGRGAPTCGACTASRSSAACSNRSQVHDSP